MTETVTDWTTLDPNVVGVLTCACGHRVLKWADEPEETFTRAVEAHVDAHRRLAAQAAS